MEASMKYPLNPLAACFVPLSMKAHTGKINRDVHSIESKKSISFCRFTSEAPSANKTRTTDNSGVKNLDLISKHTTFEDLCFTSKNSEMYESVQTRVAPEKLISDEASIDRSEDRITVEKVDLMEQKDMTGNCLMELERTSNMAYENTDPFEIERTSDMDENADSVKINFTSKIARENIDSEIVKVNSILERGENLVDSDTPGQYASISSTESIQSTKSFQSDYGTDVENIDTEDSSNLPTAMMTRLKSRNVKSKRETNSKFVSGGSEQNLSLQTKSSNSLSLYLSFLLGSILPSKDGKAKASSKEILKAGPKFNEECVCPPMFGWIVPFEYFGNPLNLTETCKKNHVHTTYEHAIYDHASSVQTTVYSKSLDFENNSIDSGHCSDEDGPLSSVDEVDTLEQCSSELESIIKDVFDCVDKSLSMCEDEKPGTAHKDSKVWRTANETEVFTVEDSSVVDDGIHPLLKERTPEKEVDIGISKIEKYLGDAFAFGDKHVNEQYSSQSCILPCSVWCTKVPPPVVDTYKRFVKKIDSEPINRNIADERKVFRKPIYKRCFSANDTPKGFDYGVQHLASNWEPEAQFCRKDLSAFNDPKGTAINNNNLMSSNYSPGKPTNPLKEGSDTWCLYDGADSLWQPLPDCILSNDLAQKYAYKRARIMRRQKSVG